MAKPTDSDQTLPSLTAALPGNDSGEQLSLTIIFHACTARIGERAVLPWHQQQQQPWILGRLGPAFGRGEVATGLALQDRHVSRRALEFTRSGDRLLLARPHAASRCRVLGREMSDEVELDREELQRGVPLMLGHSVVLLLRLVSNDTLAVVDDDLGLCGSSYYLQRLRGEILQAADNDVDVLVRGETGTGKELVATAVHRLSMRAAGPMVSVNMAAVSAELAPAALFGTARGAFTGADKATAGYFRQAQGGCLFLDEIGDMPVEVQAQLLRALQQREVQSVGGAIHRVDLRVISATDAALDGEGSDFKAALRHRLGAVDIALLPLREHPEDIGELALACFGESANALQAVALLPDEHSSARAIASWAELFHRLLQHDWPGNVRELENTCRQIVVASAQQLTIPTHIHQRLSKTPAVNGSACVAGRRKLRDVGAAEFEQRWGESGFEVMGCARLLRVSRASVYRRIQDSADYRLASQVPLEELGGALANCAGDSATAAQQLRVSHTGLQVVLRNSPLEWH